jgi:hypothetical protein
VRFTFHGVTFTVHTEAELLYLIERLQARVA